MRDFNAAAAAVKSEEPEHASDHVDDADKAWAAEWAAEYEEWLDSVYSVRCEESGLTDADLYPHGRD